MYSTATEQLFTADEQIINTGYHQREGREEGDININTELTGYNTLHTAQPDGITRSQGDRVGWSGPSSCLWDGEDIVDHHPTLNINTITADLV